MQSYDAVTAVLPVVAALERLGIRYYIGGSVASSAYGHVRTTLDVDLVADLQPQHVGPLAAALEGSYYVSVAVIHEALARRSCFNLIHLATMFKVDVFVVGQHAYDRQAFARIRPGLIDDDNPASRVLFASPEDVILSKLQWYRLGEEVSETQWRDVLGVMRAQGESLDREYLHRWAAELGLADLLEKAWEEGR